MMALDLALVLVPVAIWTAVSFGARADPVRAAWPPARGNWLTAVWAWGITILIYMGLVGIGTRDWNPHELPRWFTWGVGGGLALAGNLLHAKSLADLGLRGTSGWDLGVIEAGSYGWLRHPQYLGQGLGFVGWGLMAANLPVLALAILVAAALWVVGDAEERVLAARHPAAHERYRDRVPGWLPRLPP